MTGLYFTQFNFSDELQQVLIASGFTFYKADSFPAVHEENWNTFSPFHIYNVYKSVCCWEEAKVTHE